MRFVRGAGWGAGIIGVAGLSQGYRCDDGVA